MIFAIPLMLGAAAPCPLPAGWGLYSADGDLPNSVVLMDKKAYWNATPVTDDQLTGYARSVGGIRGAQIILKMQKVDCEALKRTAALIAKAANCTPEKCVVNFNWGKRD